MRNKLNCADEWLNCADEWKWNTFHAAKQEKQCFYQIHL